MTKRRGFAMRAAVLGGILLYLLMQKLAFNPQPFGKWRHDGTFYYQIAQHVAAGEGLLTSVSLYHQGLRKLPAPSTIYPLWPLVLGGAGRWIGLERAASLIPKILFFVDLLLLYLLANRIGAALGGAVWLRFRNLPLVDLGHVAVVLFGTNTMFFVHTSVPWTEGLAFACLFGALLAVEPAARGRSLQWAAAAGVLAGLAYLTRSQMIGVSLAVATALLFADREGPRWRLAGGALAGSAIVVLPWILYLASFVTHFPPRMLLDFTAYRETPELPSYPGFVSYGSFGERLADFAGSFIAAFHPTRPLSYVRSFGPPVYLVPVAIGWAGWALWRVQRAGVRERSRHGPREALALACVLAALLCLLPLHAMHETTGTPWRFGHRQGLPLVLGIVATLAALWHWKPVGRALVILALAGHAVLPAQHPPGWVHLSPKPTVAERSMMDWLERHRDPPVVASTRVRELAAWRGITGHGISCFFPAGHTRAMFRYLDIDYLIVYAGEKKCAFARELEGLEEVRQFGHGSKAIFLFRFRRPQPEPGG